MRFLWDAHNCEEAREEEELVVSTPYIEHWNDLIDLWYLGMQVGTSVQTFHTYRWGCLEYQSVRILVMTVDI